MKESSKKVDVATVTKLIREALDQNDKYFEFAQNQIDKDREYFKFMYQVTIGFLLLVIIGGTYFIISAANDFKNNIEIEAQSTIKQAIASVHEEVADRINDEFKNGNMNATLVAAIKEHTGDEIKTTIFSEVTKALEAQRPIVQKAIDDQAQEVVAKVEPSVRASMDSMTEEQIKSAIAPVQARMDALCDILKIGNTVILARNGDRPAFDELLKITQEETPDNKNTQAHILAQSTVKAITTEKQSTLPTRLTFKELHTPEELKKLMFDENVTNREAAIDNYPEDDKTIIPLLVTIIKTDNNLDMLNRTVARFNHLTNQSFTFWKTQEILDWWEINKTAFQ
jgi:uncharacterized protein (UPF0333 family)